MKEIIRKILKESNEIRVKQVIDVPKSIDKIHEIFKENDFKLYLVGGAVRDTLTGRRPKDFDLATDATPEKIKELLHMYQTIESGEQFGVVNVVTEDDTYEIATFREDIGVGRRPDEVKFTTIDKDVLRRDLTINALFYDLDTKEIVDLVGGISDLENGIVKTVGDAGDRFNEDKLRIMRAMRFAARIGSEVDEGIEKAIRNDNSIISGDGKPLAQERIQDEFVKGIKQAKSSVHFIELLKKFDLLKWVFRDMDVSGSVVKSKSPVVVIASLLKNDTSDIRQLVSKLKFTKLQGKQIKFLIDFLRDGSPETAFDFKTKIKSLHMDGSIIANFGSLNGMDKQFIKAFNKFEITTDGNTLVKQGFKGKDLQDEKRRLETELFKISMGRSTISYSGVILDKDSHNQLISLLHENFQDIEGWVEVSHHMTVVLGPLPIKYRGLIGQDFDLTVTHIGYTDDVIAVKVDTSFDVENPHVTVATSPSGRPEMSRDITEWNPILPLNISGILREITH
jgi:tRNA nucleotidyltransferase/poly(A) polymerase